MAIWSIFHPYHLNNLSDVVKVIQTAPLYRRVYERYPLLIAYNMNQQRIFSVQATIPLDDLKNLVINAYLAAW